MSLPKEPRQKMINMMYLVLTAMLALNVSAEILNAFKTVNNSIVSSNGVIIDKNKVTYNSFDEKLKQQETRANAEIWAPKAKAVQKISADLYQHIEDLKNKLIENSGPYVEEGVKTFRQDDLDAPTRLMVEEGEGPKLYNDLKQFKQQLLSVLKPEEFAANAVLQADVKRAKEDFDKQLPLNLQIPESQAGNVKTGNDDKDWTTNYFQMTPSVAALTILSKFQNDVKNSESQMIDYLHKKIGEVTIHYDKTGVIAGANSTYLMPGDKLTVYAGVGAFSSAAQPTVNINGETLKVDADGKATKDITVGGSGRQTVRVNVSYKDQDGLVKNQVKEIEYTVGTPSGIAVSADKMNVLYIMGEVPNPLTISGGAGSEKIQAALTGGNLKHLQGSAWEAYPKTPGEQNINVTIDGKTTAKKFRVKYLPDPQAFIGTKKGGAMPAAEFKAMGGLITKLENSDFEVGFKVVSYRIGAIGGPLSGYQQYSNDGNRWTGNAGNLISKVGPGTSVFFDDIRVIGPDGRNREIQGIFFNLK